MAALINPAAISAYAQAAKAAATGGGEAVPGTSFGEMLSGVMKDAVDAGRAAEAKTSTVAQGKGDLVDVVTAVNAAEVTLETVVAIRDRVISAYQDIMRMPI